MKSSLKKGKPVIEMHAPDRRALEAARAVADFVCKNTTDDELREEAAKTFVGLGSILEAFPEKCSTAQAIAAVTAGMASDDMLAEKHAESAA